MKLLTRNAFALFAASATLLTSCSDDVLNRETPEGDNYSVTVYVPNTADGIPQGTGTRALGSMADWNKAESQIHSLMLIAYPIKNDQTLDPVAIDLLDTGNVTVTSGSNDDYKAYSFQIDNGDYRMYVVANSNVTGTESETILKQQTAVVPTDVEAQGIPMACAHNELIVNGSSIGDANVITVSSTGATAKVRADLKFAVSKVRVTLLNDLRISEGVTDVGVSGHAAHSSLFTNTSYSAPVATGQFTPANAYYDMPAKSDTLKNTNVDALTGKSSTLPAKEWAWQTIFYVPERLVQSAGDNTHMDYKIGTQPRKLEIGEVAGTTRKIERSHFYDYVGTPEGKFYLTVQKWDPAIIAGALHGPTFLHVDQTSIDIEAGEETAIWCESNAISLKGSSESFTNTAADGSTTEEPIYTFRYSQNNDTIYVSLNRQIDAKEIENVKAEGKWKSFTITAGTINKKIEVRDIIFEEYITVSPKIMTIDVAENKESGDYNGTLPIRITTNMATVDLKKFYNDLLDNNTRKEGWVADADEEIDNKKSLYLTDKEGNVIGDEASYTVPESGILDLIVNFNDLNSNRTLWNKDAELLLSVSGNKVNGEKETEDVTIYVRPSYDTYKIHFKAPGWVAPHIYVYQCLELPADHPTHPNAPVGADDGHEGKTAALEYSFTGKVAFKGWYTDEYNNPNASGSFHDKFWYFDYNDDSWNENNPDTRKVGKHYILDMDFCPSHREAQPCGTCKGDGYAKGWPGICMKKTPANEAPNGETDWWEFELSGVATPGKALIMFQDMFVDQNGNVYHESYANDSRRYPDSEEPGIPLFDYPTKEGWLVYEGRDGSGKLKPIKFTSQRPGTADVYNTYRIYWPYNASNWTGINVWQDNNVWGNKVYTNFASGAEQSFRGFKYGKFNNSYAYLEFQTVNTVLKGQFNYQSQKGEGQGDYSAEYKANFNNFVKVDGVYCYTLTARGAGKAGKPDGEEIIVTPSTGAYRIQWNSTQDGTSEKFDAINVFGFTNIKNGLSGIFDASSESGSDIRYYQFEPDNANSDFSFSFNLKNAGTDWKAQTGNIEVSKNDFNGKKKLMITIRKSDPNNDKSYVLVSKTPVD
ncbi:MAG: hypothetical protein K2M59_00215 [Muribaculaceae bacterium]|nr:hypothetical protein [Muribaculaceae bacterium]